MVSNDVKLLAVYEDLLERIQKLSALAEKVEAGVDGRDGKDGKDGRDAPDITKELFAAIGTLHSDLIKQMISAQREITVTPEITVSSGDRVYDVERDNRGFVTRIRSKPADSLI